MAKPGESLSERTGEGALVRLVLALVALVLALLALAMAGGMWLYLVQTGHIRTGYALDVRAPDAQGIQAGAPVRMAGVGVGTVAQVTLSGRQADLHLNMTSGVQIPRGSRFLVVSSLLDPPGGVRVIPADASDAIRPGDSPLTGESGPDLSQTLTQAALLMRDADRVTRHTDAAVQTVNGLMGDRHLQGDVTQTLDNVRAATAGGLQVTRQAQDTLAATARATDQVAATVQAGRPQVQGILQDVHTTTSTMSGLTTRTVKLLTSPPVVKTMSALVGDLKGTLDNLKSTTDHLSALTGTDAKLAGDPQVQSDLKDTLHNVRDLTAKTSTLLDALTKAAAAKPGR